MKSTQGRVVNFAQMRFDFIDVLQVWVAGRFKIVVHFFKIFFLIFRDWNAIERQLNDFVDIFVEQFFEPTKHRLAARAN